MSGPMIGYSLNDKHHQHSMDVGGEGYSGRHQPIPEVLRTLYIHGFTTILEFSYQIRCIILSVQSYNP